MKSRTPRYHGGPDFGEHGFHLRQTQLVIDYELQRIFINSFAILVCYFDVRCIFEKQGSLLDIIVRDRLLIDRCHNANLCKQGGAPQHAGGNQNLVSMFMFAFMF